MSMELADPQGQLFAEIGDPAFKIKDVTLTYAMALCSSMAPGLDWPRINSAIMNRWSVNALDRIKRDAWRLVKEKEASNG